ncbi:MAG TPA: hypothetical protein VMA36_13165 [Candidatus Limnocylindria bacterium]|nr:hypothetical protein [Candidatus Limnocylindria bacterium]
MRLDADQQASYAALCEDVVTIVAVAGLPRAAREDGHVVTRAYLSALRSPSRERWRAYHRAVATLLEDCAPAASRALDFPAVAACLRLRAFLRENEDLAIGGVRHRARAAVRRTA